jgi:hypothetical protein
MEHIGKYKNYDFIEFPVCYHNSHFHHSVFSPAMEKRVVFNPLPVVIAACFPFVFKTFQPDNYLVDAAEHCIFPDNGFF